MKKIILLLLSLQAIKLSAAFVSDQTLTPTQQNAMRTFEDARRVPNQMVSMNCVCIRCGNYVWNTCGGNNWVKNGLCTYRQRTLPACL